MFEGGNKLKRRHLGAVLCRQLIRGTDRTEQQKQKQTGQHKKLNTNNK